MKLKAPRNSLLEAATACATVANTKGTMPILACAKLDFERGTVAATDLEVATTVEFGGKTEGNSSICINAKALAERVRMMPDGDVTISVTDNTATIKSGKRYYSLKTFPGEEFPAIPQFDGDGVRVERLPLLDAISSTIYAVSQDVTRLHLHSLLVTAEDGELLCAATDGHRLSIDRQPIEWSLQEALIPLNGALRIKKLLEDAKDQDTVTIGVNGQLGGGSNRIDWFVSAGFTELSVKLVDALFPPYQQVVPETTEAQHRVSRLALLDAVRAVSVAAGERTGGVKLTFKGATCTIEAETVESGEGHDVVELIGDADQPRLFFGCNGKYLVEALNSFVGDTVTVEGSGELDPVKISDGGKRLNITMPMRV